MAKLYPSIIIGGQSRAETKVFNIFQTFSDDFHIIHSLPWLSLLTSKQIDRYTPEGEIDFVILNKNYGILCVEIKGGIISYKENAYFTNGYILKKTPYKQVIDNQHYLRNIVNNMRIGYCVGFPDSKMPNFTNDNKIITFDINDLDNLANKITSIFEYWKNAIKKRTPTETEIEEVLQRLLPESKDELHQKIVYDNKEWLTLSKEQTTIINNAIQSKRFFIGGRAGTGKTVLAIIMARVLLKKDSKILFLTFNKLINEYIKKELTHQDIDTYTFHKFLDIHKNYKQDTVEDSLDILKNIVEKINNYDVLIIDEAQSFNKIWLNLLSKYFIEKQVYIFADSLQSFLNEGKISDKEMDAIFHFDKSMVLTKNYRSPRKVYERLLEMFDSSIQQVSPRDIDSLDLIEKISDDAENTLYQTIDDLLKKDLLINNITILMSSKEKHNSKLFKYKSIEVETIHRYRGMEKPIIIYILTSASKDDLHELYIAYSRATTQTIVIIPKTVIEVGKSKIKEILIESDFTDKNTKENINIVSNEFENIFIKRYPKEIQILKIRYSNNFFLFQDKKYRFMNTLLQNYLLSKNIYFLEVNSYNEKQATVFSPRYENFLVEINTCENCGQKDFIRSIHCLDCMKNIALEKKTFIKFKKLHWSNIIQKLTFTDFQYHYNEFCKTFNIKEKNILNDIDIMFNPLSYNQKNRNILDDSLKSLGRLFWIFNKNKKIKFTDGTLNLLNHNDVMCISFTIEVLLLLVDYKNDKIITLEEIRKTPKIKRLNGLSELDEKQWKSKTGVYINRFITKKLFTKINSTEKKYVIHRNKIFQKR